MPLQALLRKFTSQDLLFIAVFSALGLAVKPVITPLIHLISAPLLIPGGSLAGGLYMMWIVLAICVVNKPGTGILVGLVQSLVIFSLGYFGSHGAVTLISYTLPGFAAEFVSLFFPAKRSLLAPVLICAAANLTGSLVVTILVMRLALIPLLIALITALISGILGGILAWYLWRELTKFRLIPGRVK